MNNNLKQLQSYKLNRLQEMKELKIKAAYLICTYIQHFVCNIDNTVQYIFKIT